MNCFVLESTQNEKLLLFETYSNSQEHLNILRGAPAAKIPYCNKSELSQYSTEYTSGDTIRVCFKKRTAALKS